MAGEIKHEWFGTVLTITSDSGTSSMDLQGEKGTTGPRGPQGRAGVILNADGTINMGGYATEAYVDEQIANVATGGAIDLSNYATKDYVAEQIASGGTGGSIDLTNYYTKAETNAAIKNAVDAIDIPETDLTGYALKTDIPTKVSSFTNDAGYATTSYVDQKVAAGGGSGGGGADLTNYYNKTEIDQKFVAAQNAMQQEVSEAVEHYGLPTPGIDDDGKTLVIDNGEWVIAENSSSGSGDDTNVECSLPSVTSADNGKFLMVVDGAWTATAIANFEEVSF